MADLLMDNEAPPNTPAAGQGVWFTDNVSKRASHKKDDGSVDTLADVRNFSTANQTGFAADTYLTGANIKMPRALPRAGLTYRVRFDMTKTAAGTAAPTVIVRYGTNGTIADAAVMTFTFAAGTAAADTGLFELLVHFRTVGSGTAAVLVGLTQCTHHLAATGLTSTGAAGVAIILVTSAGFDSTPLDSFLGVSFNGGASFSGTNTMVQAEVLGG